MRIRTNNHSNNSYNSLRMNKSDLSKEIEKLSSGLKINRAADDASGLAMSRKMHAQITGLEQAQLNVQDAVSLVQTGEGALNEVHSMLNRMLAITQKSANGTVQDEVDRSALQQELSDLRSEIDRIASSTKYNGIELFQDKGLSEETNLQGSFSDSSVKTKVFIESYVASYEETVCTPSGSETNTGLNSNDLIKKLDEEIVPNVVNSLMARYPAFKYLDDNTVGIGLKLYSDAASSTLAFVQLSASTAGSGVLSYQLAVNTAKINISTPSDRSTLESVIAHEMMHAFMDEAMTAGMTGYTGSNFSGSYEFPKWFKEGTAQTMSGPGNWVQGGLALTQSSTDAQIKSALQNNSLSKSETNSASAYGTGYLAVMYMGYLSNGGGTVTEDGIAAGIDKILTAIRDGASLDDAINDLVPGYDGLNDFESNFANDSGIGNFVREVISQTGNNGLGSLLKGDFSNIDVVANSSASSNDLFDLNITNEEITNDYDDTYNVFSGGTKFAGGTPPESTMNTYVPTSGGSSNPANPGGSAGGFIMQIGSSCEEILGVPNFYFSGKALKLDTVDISAQDSAANAISVVKNAINRTSEIRGKYGAIRNRLEHTMNSLQNTAENLTAANSRIEDTDMAKSMMKYTGFNILLQASQSMLAQANQLPQSILQLLQ